MHSGSEPVQSVSAVTLLTADMAAAVGFYQRIGFRLVYGGPQAAFSSFAAGAGFLNLQLEPGSAPLPAVWGRVIFWVDDVDAMFDRVASAGFGALGEPADAAWGERFFHVRDPDGHELSFARPLDSPAVPADRNQDRPETAI